MRLKLVTSANEQDKLLKSNENKKKTLFLILTQQLKASLIGAHIKRTISSGVRFSNSLK